MNLKKKLPVILQSNPFWLDYADAVQAELERLLASFEPKRDYFDPDSKTTIDELRTYFNEFGMKVNISLYEDLYESNPEEIVAFLKREADAMAYVIRKKGTKDFYDHLFNRISRKGYSYVMFSDNSQKRIPLFRALQIEGTTSILNDLLAHDPTKPFIKVHPEIPFIDAFVVTKNLDSADNLKLDDSANPWLLDSWLAAQSVKNTTHIAIEFMLDRIYNGTDLVDNKFLEYLRNSIAVGRKVSQIPHFGVGLSLMGHGDGTVKTIPDVGASVQVVGDVYTPQPVLTDVYNLFRVGWGATTYYEDKISANEIFRNESFDIITLTIPSKAIYPDTIEPGANGVQTTFNKTLLKKIVPRSLRVFFEDQNSVKHVVKDDGEGRLYFEEYENNLDDEGYSGTIDYETKDLTLICQTITQTFVPKLGTTIYAYYRTSEELPVNSLKLFDVNSYPVLNASFTRINLNSTLYHMSFLVIVDKRGFTPVP